MAYKSSKVDLGNNILNIWIGIKLLSLPKSILHVMCIPFWLVHNCMFSDYYRFYIVKLKIFNFYQIKAPVTLSSLNCLGLLALTYVMDWLSTPWWFLTLQLSWHWPAHCLYCLRGCPVPHSTYNFPLTSIFVSQCCIFVYFTLLNQSLWPPICYLALPFAPSGPLTVSIH